MSASQRRKGAIGEREACEALRAAIGGVWVRGGSAQARRPSAAAQRPADVVSDAFPRVHIEVKRQARPSPYAALEQAVDAAGDSMPIALMRRDRDPLGWVVCVRLDDLAALAHAIVDEQR